MPTGSSGSAKTAQPERIGIPWSRTTLLEGEMSASLRHGVIGAVVLAVLFLAMTPHATASPAEPDRWEVRVAERVPEFASAFIDGQGTLQLRVTDTSDAVVDELRDILKGMFGDLIARDRVEVQAVPYGFLELQALLAGILDELASVNGVTMWGIGHDPPAVLIGTVDADAQAQVRAMLGRNGVPDDAVDFLLVGYPITDELVITRPRAEAPPAVEHVQPEPPAWHVRWPNLVAAAVIVLGLIALTTWAVRRRAGDATPVS
jgi:hypothetical protein